MRVSNQSGGPTTYNQGGSNPEPERTDPPLQEGELGSGQETPEFVPSGNPPYWVKFTGEGYEVTSCKFSNPDAVVTLNKNRTVSVSTGCD
jgi:hypothetical protein